MLRVIWFSKESFKRFVYKDEMKLIATYRPYSINFSLPKKLTQSFFYMKIQLIYHS